MKYILLIFIILFSCKQSSTKKTIELKQIYELNTLVLKHPDASFLNFYDFIAYDSSENVFYGLNQIHFKIDVFSIDKNFESYSIQLSKDGPDSIEDIISGIAVVDENFLIVGLNFIYEVDKNGLVKNKIEINASSNDTMLHTQPIYDTNANVIEIISSNSYILKTVNYQNSLRNETKAYFENYSHAVVYDKNKNSFEDLSIKYPPEYQNNFYDFNTRFTMKYDVNLNSLYYLFEGTPSYYLLNLNQNKHKEISIPIQQLTNYKSKFKSFENPQLNDINHYITNSNLDGISVTNNYIVIFHHSSQPIDKIDNTLNTKNKVRELMVFDKKDNTYLGKILLNVKISPHSHFFIEDTLYFQFFGDDKNENTLEFLKVKLL